MRLIVGVLIYLYAKKPYYYYRKLYVRRRRQWQCQQEKNQCRRHVTRSGNMHNNLEICIRNVYAHLSITVNLLVVREEIIVRV